MLRRTALLLTSLFLAFGLAAGKPAFSPVVIADFQSGSPKGIEVTNATSKVEKEKGDAKNRFLQLTPSASANKLTIVRLPLPFGTNAGVMGGFDARVRVKADSDVVMRIYATDQGGKHLFQRRVELKPSDTWTSVSEPLNAFRWGNDSVGNWGDARVLALAFEGAPSSISLDDLRLTPAGTKTHARLTANEIAELAFPKSDERRLLRDDDLMAVSDVAGQTNDEDLKKYVANMKKARAFVIRAFGDAVNPLEGEISTLLVFSTSDAYKEFFDRLGKEWKVNIAPPTVGGYTVQTFATSAWDPKQGIDRPVYLHEAVHAILGQQVRIPSGTARAGWLQEGTAFYVQVCATPKSLGPVQYYPAAFKAAQEDINKGPFIPLEKLMSTRTPLNNYPQAASVIAYLLETDPKLLADIAKAIADNKPPQEALKAHNLTLDQFQDAWIAWGVKKFDKPRTDGRHFDPLPEFEEVSVKGKKRNAPK